MTLGLNLGLHQSSAGSFLGDGTAIAGILDLLQPERNGLAFDFLQDDPQLLIRDEANPLNDYLGSFNDKIAGAWNSPKLIGQIDDREYVRNQTMTGAVAGTPGTAPTSWVAMGIPAGVTRQIVGVGVENGITYIEARFSGTIAATNGVAIDPDGSIPGTTQQRWRVSMYVSLVAGSLGNISDTHLLVREGDSSNALVSPSGINAHRSANINGQLTSTLTAFSADVETTGGLATRFLTPRLQFYSATGGAVDFTIRIGLPSFKRLDVVYDHAPHNYIRNSAILGVVAGTPGTVPTHWNVSAATSFINRTVLGSEVYEGVECLRIRFHGVNTSGGFVYPDVNFDGNNNIVAASGMTFTASAYVALVGGALPSTGARIRVMEANSGGTYLTEGATNITSLSASLQRISHTRTCTNASTAFTNGSLSFSIPNGETYDFTILVGLPQLERRAWAGTPIRTTGSARFPVFPESITSRNEIRNSTMVGVVPGTPGTLPTNWAPALHGTLTQTVVGTGIENGIEYVDLRLSGTTSTTASGWGLESSTQIFAASGQTWAQSAFMAIVGGSLTNITIVRAVYVDEMTSGGAYVATKTGADIKASLSSTLTRFSEAVTLSGGATVARIRPLIYISHSIGVAIDITLRIGRPQLEQRAFATDPIRTTGLARNGNTVLGVPIEGSRTNAITNNTMQGAVAGSPGTIPTNWNLLNANGLTRTISRGVIDGQDYIDIRFNGTTIDGSGIQLDFSLFTAIAALTGQTWTVGANLALVGGSTANINLALNLREGTSGGTLVLINSPANIHQSLTPVLQRFTYSVTLSGGGTVANVTPRINIGFSSGVAVDFTLRIALPQLEQAAFPSLTPIRTVNAAVTRAADAPGLAVANFPSMASGGHMMVEHIAGTTSVGAGVLALRQDASNSTGIFQDTVNLNYLNNVAASPAPGLTALSPMVARRTYRTAASFRSNDHKTAANGNTIAKSASGATLPNYAELRFGWMTSGPNDFSFGYLRRGRVVPRTLSDTETVALSRLAA